MRCEVVREMHNRDHFDILKKKELLRQEFYILKNHIKLRKKVKSVISNCVDYISFSMKLSNVEGF